MAKAEISAVQETVEKTLAQSTIAAQFDGIAVDSDRHDDGFEFLRVKLRRSLFARLSDAQLTDITLKIEDAVGEIDDRVISVRFGERN